MQATTDLMQLFCGRITGNDGRDIGEARVQSTEERCGLHHQGMESSPHGRRCHSDYSDSSIVHPIILAFNKIESNKSANDSDRAPLLVR